ncbi:Gfo/Idh/MocA family protein [Paenarthrobacter sp. NyZ202]|uniref:Gfo/Idh/MocA family protein n=1 Tax=Paenarthrobacter sp. NyZ202 TaxID=3402689 RepID=UPI003CF55F59
MYKVGILGAGMIAEVPSGFLAGMQALAHRANVTAISSRSRERAVLLAERFGIPYVYDDLDSMLAGEGVDIVINATPIGAHFETSKAILSAGKHLVSEKPFALRLTEALELEDLAKSAGVQVAVAPSRMLEPSRQRAVTLIEAGAIGAVHSARVRVAHAGPGGMPWPRDPRPAYSSSEGPLRDLAPYAFEQVLGLLGPVRQVCAMTLKSRPLIRAYGHGPFEGIDIPVESPDIVGILMETEGGCLVSIDCSYGQVGSRAPSIELFGEAGTINLYTRYGADAGPRIELLQRGSGRPGEWIDPGTMSDRHRESELAVLGRAGLVECLLNALDEARPAYMGSKAATQIVRLIEAVERSALERRVVEPD